MKDALGKVVGRRHRIRMRAAVQYTFRDLHAAFSEYLDAVVTTLQKLSDIEILRRYERKGRAEKAAG